MYLEGLKGVVKLGFAGATGRRHDNSGWNRGNAPTEFVSGQHSEFVPMGRPQVVDDVVLVSDIIRQIHPIDVGIWLKNELFSN